MSFVFLGGTCNETSWREELINRLKVSYYNPVVPDWTPECQAEETEQKEVSAYCLYVITPRKIGDFAIAEAVDDSNKKPKRTLFCILYEPDEPERFSKAQIRSLEAVTKLIKNNGAIVLDSLVDIATFLNTAKG